MSNIEAHPRKWGLTNNQLKIIAMISMAVDHVGVALFPYNQIFRIIGRLAFPIFSYMIAEGCRHTKNRKRYLGLILTMAIVFQLFYFVFMGDIYQGILVTFSLSIAIIFSIESFFRNEGIKNKILMLLVLLACLSFGIGFPILYGAQGFAVDYDAWGIFLPVLIYFAPKKIWKVSVTALVLVAMSILASSMQWWALLAVPLLALYNGERGRAKMKYVFYIFYPLHLVIIYAIAIAIQLF